MKKPIPVSRSALVGAVIAVTIIGIPLAVRAGGASVRETRVPGDTNCDGKLDMSDAIFTLNYLFVGTALPPCPLADPPELLATIAELESTLTSTHTELEDCKTNFLREQAVRQAAELQVAQLQATLMDSQAEVERLSSTLASCKSERDVLISLCRPGCTDPAAKNYSSRATIDDGSCVIEGCTDSAAFNFEPRATVDDGTCVALPEIPGFMLLTEANEQGFAEYVHERTQIVFVLLPGGTFRMGSLEEEVGSSGCEHPQHEVTLNPFLIAKYELTQEQFQAVRGYNPSFFSGNDLLPADSVQWAEAMTFCKEVGLVLPTEAQWEYACRAGTTTPYFFGETLPADEANFSGQVGQTVPVGSYRPNALGLYNMHGNVTEWCRDALQCPDNLYTFENFYASQEAAEPDPVLDCLAWNQVSRGGSWSDPAETCRSAARGGGGPFVPRDRRYGIRPAYYYYSASKSLPQGHLL